MISAEEAMQLDRAQPPPEVRAQFLAVMEALKRHICQSMTFGGPGPFKVQFEDMSKATCLIVCRAMMRRYKWDIRAQLMAQESRFGGKPRDDHWMLHIAPAVEVYDELPLMRELLERHETSPSLVVDG